MYIMYIFYYWPIFYYVYIIYDNNLEIYNKFINFRNSTDILNFLLVLLGLIFYYFYLKDLSQIF